MAQQAEKTVSIYRWREPLRHHQIVWVRYRFIAGCLKEFQSAREFVARVLLHRAGSRSGILPRSGRCSMARYNGYTGSPSRWKEFTDSSAAVRSRQHGHRACRRCHGDRPDHNDHLVLFSGERRFPPPRPRRLQRKGVRVTVVSTISTQPPMIADELAPAGRPVPGPRRIAGQGWP